MVRCYLSALTSGTNSFDISTKDFQDSIFRSGIDNPYPIIQRRINFYGNDIDLETFITELQKNECALEKFKETHIMNGNLT